MRERPPGRPGPKAAAHALPFWFTREIGEYAIVHGAGANHVVRDLVHTSITLAVVLALGAGASALRLRRLTPPGVGVS
ncbi:hypothetical protein [Cryptosporangium aurantiacum]|uniref:Uncharacterized protein n=1 Tax=Cryptosporangium aurantiacum TaxID=134849 RepID=A0A1M7R9E6_9ACTN|nr:hypothetical protein [Cryptosporangium aurantiacum]SHN42729.1 hypothetical protein SAMN05443668_108336 [Cryptosporangium aurantiacum]